MTDSNENGWMEYDKMRAQIRTLKADLARCYDVCAEAIGSEYRNVGVVEACASFVGTLQADLAAERDKSRAAEVVIELHRKRGQGLLSGMERDSSIRTLKADLAAEREAMAQAQAAIDSALRLMKVRVRTERVIESVLKLVRDIPDVNTASRLAGIDAIGILMDLGERASRIMRDLEEVR